MQQEGLWLDSVGPVGGGGNQGWGLQGAGHAAGGVQPGLADLQQKEVVVDGIRPAVRVGHCSEHIIQVLGWFRLRQGMRA